MSLNEEFETIFAKHQGETDRTSFYDETRRIENHLEKDPSLLSHENQFNLYYENGCYFNEIEDYKTALAYFQSAWKHAINLNPNGGRFTSINNIKLKVKSSLGRTYLAIGDNCKALENYKESLFWATTINAEGDHPLYSYREVNKYLLQDIINKEITVVSPKFFNDPLDCPIYTIIKKYEHIDEVRDIREVLQKAYSYIKVRSFVSNEPVIDKSIPISNELDNTEHEKESCKFLMWSHYAKDHTGICIKYRIDARFLEKDEENSIASIIYDVTYEKSLKPSKEPTQTFRQAFATKNICWKYENEVRLIHYDPNCSADFKSLPLGEYATIEAVYFGLKCSPKDIKTIRGILKEDVAYFQMKEDDEDVYKLVEVPLNDRAKAMLEATSEVETLC